MGENKVNDWETSIVIGLYHIMIDLMNIPVGFINKRKVIV